MIGDNDSSSVNRFNAHGHGEGPPSLPQYHDARLPPLHRTLAEDVPPVSGSAYYGPSHFSASRLAQHQYSTEPPMDTQYHGPQRQEYGYADSQPASTNTVVYSAAHFQPAGPAHPTGALIQGGASIGDGSFMGSPPVHDPPSPTAANARRLGHTTSDIGTFMTFTSGPLEGRTIRAEICEVQKADLGRKCADPPTAASSSSHKAKEKEKDKDETRNVRKDRRPLDPPPVVRLRLIECFNRGTPQEYEREIPPDDVEVSGLVCQVDIFRVTIPPSPGEMGMHWAANQGYRGHSTAPVGGEFAHPAGSPTYSQQHQTHQTPYSPYTHGQQQSFTYPPRAGPSGTSGESLMIVGEGDTGGRFADVPPTPHSASAIRGPGVHGWSEHADSPVSPSSPTSTYTFQPHGHYGGASGNQNASIDPDALPPPTEADKLNRVLFGESFTHACSILDLNGQPTIFFVFADLSVKLEGLFRPRYRFFDLFSRTVGNIHVPILAECFGGCFAVYSTKEFPGLKRSTPLTKHLSRWGIRVNIRETERKRRAGDKKANADEEGSASSSKRASSSKKGKSKKGKAVDSSSTTSDERHRDGEGAGRVAIPRGVDAPRRYLEDTTRGKKRTRGA